MDEPEPRKQHRASAGLKPGPAELATRPKPTAEQRARAEMLRSNALRERNEACDPSPEELGARITGAPKPPAAVPPEVMALITTIFAALEALEPDARAATLAELRRLAG